MNNLAILINSPEPFFLKSAERQDFFIVAEKRSPLEIFAKNNFHQSKIITYNYRFPSKLNEPASLTLTDLLEKTNFTRQLLAKKVEYFFVPYRSSKKIEKWTKTTGIKLIVTPLALQERLENKDYFDNFLKKHCLASPPRILKQQIKNRGNYVIQEAKSSDYFRTKFFPGGNKLARYLKQKNVNLKKFVIRQYLPGMPVGVSIFIDTAGNYFFSALRRQCFIYQKEFPKEFLGIQWLKTGYFSPAIIIKINRLLKKLTQSLIKSAFSGVANVDLIIYKNQPYILECNPRLSMAMPQAFSYAGLTTYKKPWQFYLKSFFHQNPVNIRTPRLPANKYTGAVLDLTNNSKTTIKNALPIGVYKMRNGKIVFISNSIKDFKQRKDGFFLFHELTKGQILGRGYSLCAIFSNFPIFDHKSGTLNNNGKKLYNYFNEAFSH